MALADALNLLCQVIIPVTGLTAMYLVASDSPRRRMWAGIVGLSGEPFWITTAALAEQWGIVVLAFVYTVSWWRVYRNNALLARGIE